MSGGVAVNDLWLSQVIDHINHVEGFVYLLHFERPVGRPQSAENRELYGLPQRSKPYIPLARHYLGWTDDLAVRIQAHRSGHGSSFTRAAKAQGIGFVVARVWLGDRQLERKLKRQKCAPRLCPFCTAGLQMSLFDELTPQRIALELIPF